MKKHHAFLLRSCGVILLAAITSTITCFGSEKKSPLDQPQSPLSETSIHPHITKISSESGDSISLITIETDGPNLPNSQLPVEVLGSYLQVNLGDIQYDKKDFFMDIQSPYLTKMAVYRNGSGNLIARIFSSHPAELVEKALEVKSVANRILATLDHQILKKALSDTKSSPSATLTSSTEENAEKEPLLAERLQNKPVSGSTLAPSAVFSLEKLAIISAFLICLMLASVALKPLVQKHKRRLAMSNQDAMVSLGSLSLGPKQQVSLIQVGKERLLLSVGPGGISLLKDMDAPKITFAPNPPSVQAKSPVAAPKKIQSAAVPRITGGSDSKRENPSLTSQIPARTAAEKLSEESPAVRATISNRSNERMTSENSRTASDPKTARRPPETIEDITNLLREKLKNLPAM
jgi:flagellar biogenesis protein FliO